MQRLDKLLSEAGVASRKELKTIIRAGRVTVDGIVVKVPETKVDETAADVRVDGQPVGKQRTIILMLHKPAGFVTSTDDPRDRTVMELLPPEIRYLDPKPVGRLDKDTEGLLLFTNDGCWPTGFCLRGIRSGNGITPSTKEKRISPMWRPLRQASP